MKGIPDNADLDTLFGFVPGQGSPFDYVPTWMRVPNIHPTNGNPIAVIKLFHPASGWEWYITEVDRRTHEAFGLVAGDVVEMGCFSLLEIAQIGPIRVERDLYFHPTPLEEIRRAKAHPHRQEDTVQLPEMHEEDPEPQETSKVTVPNVQQEEHPQQELHGEESAEEAQAEASPRRRRREAQANGQAEEAQSKSTKQKARPRYQAGDITLEHGQPIQVMIGWKWREATVHAVSGRNLIYQVEGGRRGKTPVAGREITWRLAT